MIKRRKGKYQPIDHIIFGIFAAINGLFADAATYKERQVWNIEKYVLNMITECALKRRKEGIRRLFLSIRKTISDLNKLEDGPEKEAALKFWKLAMKTFTEKAKINGISEEEYKGRKIHE